MPEPTVLITGGCGFVGSHLVELLMCLQQRSGSFRTGKAETEYDASDEAVDHDQYELVKTALEGVNVRVFDRNPKPLFLDEWNQNLFDQVEFIQGDLLRYKDVESAIQGCDAVIHTASLVDFGNNTKSQIYKVNVEGTKNIVKACHACNVTSLLYTSTLEVLISTDGVDGEDEDSPYVVDSGRPYHSTPYMLSKTKAEKYVLGMNGSPCADESLTLHTCAIRCTGMYGERDPYHIRSVLQAAQSMGSQNMVSMGDGSGVFQHAYGGNVAHMHVCALNKLLEGDSSIYGQVYMGIDDTKVVNFFDFFEPYLAAKRYKIPTIRIPWRVMFVVATIAEASKAAIDACTPRFRKSQLLITKQAVYGVVVTQWFRTDKARRQLGYAPIVSPMRARALSMIHFDGRLDEFPIGKFKVDMDKYNYVDDGSDYTPDRKLQSKRRKAMYHVLTQIFSVTTALAVLIIGSVLKG